MSLFRPRRVQGVAIEGNTIEGDTFLVALNDDTFEGDKEYWKARALGAEADLGRAKRFEKDRQALAEELAKRNQRLRQEIVKLKADLIEAQQASSDRQG